uniref:Uncharacterized protein n=1 Tax=Arundo donax TaxID=35708 RepID=A0A0A9CTN1_ARUDO
MITDGLPILYRAKCGTMLSANYSGLPFYCLQWLPFYRHSSITLT